MIFIGQIKRVSFKIDDELWQDFLDKAKKEINSDGSKVLRAFIEKFNEDPKDIYIKIL